MSNNSNLTKNQRRQEAREKARIARIAEKKRAKRNRLILQGIIAVVVIAAVAIGTLLFMNFKPNNVSSDITGPAPKNMISGGAVFGKDLKVVTTEALKEGSERKPTKLDPSKRPVHVQVFVDFMCPACRGFEKHYGPMLEQFTGAGDIQLEVYPVNFLDIKSNGTKYSSRAGSAFACVVDQQPDKAYAMMKQLFVKQPAENTPGLNNSTLFEIAKEAGAEPTDSLKTCIHDSAYAAFVNGNNHEAFDNEVRSLAEGERLIDLNTGKLIEGKQRLNSTPTVLVNGKQWLGQRDGELEKVILDQLGKVDKPKTN